MVLGRLQHHGVTRVVGYMELCVRVWYANGLPLDHGSTVVTSGCWLPSVVLICPIAIAQNRFASVSQSVSLSVCVSVCLSASTLTVAILHRFSPKLART